MQDLLHRALPERRDSPGARTVRRIASAAAFVLLLAFIATAPYPYGDVLPAGQVRIELAAFLAAALAMLSRPRRGWMGAGAVPLALAVSIAGLGVFQLIPLPQSILSALSPMSATIYHETSEVLRAAGSASVRPRVSVGPGETASAVLLLLSYAALAVASAVVLSRRSRRRIFAAVLLASGGVQISMAALASSGSDARIHGTFINPDHFAGYLEIALAVAFGILWAEVLTGSDRVRGIADAGEKAEKRLLPLVFRVLAWGFIAAGIALTRSRGGILAAALATVALLAAGLRLLPGKRRKEALLAASLAVLLGLAFVAGATRGNAILRFLSSDPRALRADLRVRIWQGSLKAAARSPILGTGLGTFRDAFRRVQPRDMEGLVEHAHDDALQILVTGGAVGLLLGVLLYGSLLAAGIRLIRRQRHREERCFVLAGLGAFVSLALHGLVDFNMSIPAIPATLACVLGAAWAAGRDERGPRVANPELGIRNSELGIRNDRMDS